MLKTTGPFPGENGCLILPLGWKGAKQTVVIHGGPYNAYKPSPKSFGICVRKEGTNGLTFDLRLPIVDFQVPPDSMLPQVEQAVRMAVERSLIGSDVYVGCMGGMGRTGLFLAILVKAVGIEDPVGFVREHYYGHAVETSDQKDYVENFDVTALQKTIYRRAWFICLGKLPIIGRFFR